MVTISLTTKRTNSELLKQVNTQPLLVQTELGKTVRTHNLSHRVRTLIFEGNIDGKRSLG